MRGIFFIEPNDEEFKLTMGAARRKLEVPIASSNALQHTDDEQWRKPTPILGNTRQDTLVLFMPTNARD